MELKAANEIIGLLGEYNRHFDEVAAFLREKENKIINDDVIWLNDSLVEEQKLIMKSSSFEQRRLEMLKRMGLGDIRSAELLKLMPEEKKQEFSAACSRMEKSVDEIKRLNQSALDLVERKLQVQAKRMGTSDIGVGVTEVGTYSDKASKVKHSVGDIIGSV